MKRYFANPLDDPQNKLTHETLLLLFDYDPKTGSFIAKVKMGGRTMPGSTPGCLGTDGYIRIMINGHNYLAHRLAYFYVYKKWPTAYIDHKDRNKQNNAISNLRDVSNSENAYNSSLRKHNTSGEKGVHYARRDNCWRAYINIDGKRINLGSYLSKDSAIAARKRAEAYYNATSN